MKAKRGLVLLSLVALGIALSYPVYRQDAGAEDSSDNIYKDSNGYFTFKPPPDWKKEEILSRFGSQVNFRSPGGKATLGIIAGLDGGNLNELFIAKKGVAKDYQKRYPAGKFMASRDTLGGREVVRLDFEIPRVSKQEQYFFYYNGIRFDLIYGVADPADFQNYRQVALNAFSTIQPQ